MKKRDSIFSEEELKQIIEPYQWACIIRHASDLVYMFIFIEGIGTSTNVSAPTK